ncbi:hypothetical protein M3Y96_00384400 [Aphelenchoides besseyi]|nr:hypothetical protein M3Y96_00384400 [Aphelenchoides besseyi]
MVQKKIRDVESRYFWHCGFHVHRLVIVVSMLGSLFCVFPLIYMTNRQHAHFDVGRTVSAAVSLTAYLVLFFGQTLKSKICYWFFFILTVLCIWLLAAIMAIYFAGVIIEKVLHPTALGTQLNIWWLVNVAALMTNNPQDFHPGAEVPVAILLISTSLLALFGTVFQFYFLWIAYKSYVYLTKVLLNPLSPILRVD